jgi:Ca2+-binding RTX toxin-like protein
MNVLTPLPGFDIDLSSAPEGPTMLRLHFTNWSNIDYENNPEDFLNRTTVWMDTQTSDGKSNYGWSHGESALTDIGYDTIGALLTALDINPDDAFDNRLHIVVTPTLVSGQNKNVVKPSDEYVITRNDEGDLTLRHDQNSDYSFSGFHLDGTNQSDTIKTGLGSDWVSASSGDDLLDLGANGASGNWWSDKDTVYYSGDMDVLNRSTGEYVKGYEISKNQDGSITVRDLLGTGIDNQGVDTLYGVESLNFGDNHWVQLVARESVSSWGDAENRMRRLNIDGGVFDDVIIGSVKKDDIRGGSGDDIILADGSAISYDPLSVSGGNAGEIARGSFGADDGFKDIYTQLVQVSGLAVNFSESQSRVNTYAANGSYETLDTAVKGDLYFYTDANGSEYDLSLAANEQKLAELVQGLRDKDFTAEIFAKDGSLGSYYLLDVTVAETFRSGDWIKGGLGNDFIDGGVIGTSIENPWENWNKANYEGRSSNFDIKRVEYARDAVILSDGTSVEAYASQFEIQAQSLGQLVDALGFDIVKTSLNPGDQITLVGDLIGGSGIDVLKNIQQLGFSDTWVNLGVTTQKNNWSEEGGFNIDGTIFGDLIKAGVGVVEEKHLSEGRAWFNTFSGNDIVISGAASDWINVGAGFDFVDGGSQTGTDRWQNADEVRFEGSAERFDVSQISYEDAEAYLTVEGRFDLGLLSVVDILGSDVSKTFFKVSDKAGSFGLGETVLNNVERLSFKGENLWTAPSYDRWVGPDQNTNNSDQDVFAISENINIRGSQFSDTVSLSNYSLIGDADVGGWTAALKESGKSDQEISDLLGTHTQRLHEFSVSLGAGDDVFIGDTGHGAYVRLGAGNDIAVSVPAAFSRADGAFDWKTDIDVNYDGAQQRYVLTEISKPGYILTTGEFKAGLSETDSALDVLFDLTDLANGIIKNAAGLILANNDQISKNSGLLVVDRLPEEFGGQGADLIFGFNNINFEGANYRLNTDIEVRGGPDNWLRGGVYALEVDMKDSGGYFDALGALATINQTGDFSEAILDMQWFNGSENSDLVLGTDYFNKVKLSGGDDIFITTSSTGENDLLLDSWDYYDRAEFDGVHARYEIDQIFVKVVNDPVSGSTNLEKTADGTVKRYSSEDLSSQVHQAVIVTDKLGGKGDGTDILVGIDVLEFSDQRVVITSSSSLDLNDEEFGGSFVTKFGIEDFYIEPEYRSEGSIFSDKMLGNSPTDKDAAFYRAWSAEDLDAGIIATLIDSGSLNEVPVSRDWDGDGLMTPVGIISEIYSDPFSSTDITSSMTAWEGKVYYAIVGGTKLTDAEIKAKISGVQTQFISVLNNNPSTQDLTNAQEDIVSALVELSYDDGVVVVLELKSEDPGSGADFYSVSFPMFDENDVPYLAPALSDGSDRLIGNDGDDVLVGNGGNDQFEPGRGDDLIFGSADQYDVNIDPYEDAWRTNEVRYRAESTRFEITELYGYVDYQNHKIIGGPGSLVTSMDLLAGAPTNAIASRVMVVRDTVAIDEINLGTDYLIDVGRVRFDLDNVRYQLEPNINLNQADWVPAQSDKILEGKTITQFESWDTSNFSDNIDFNTLWSDVALNPYLDEAIAVTHAVAVGDPLPGYTLKGVNRAKLGTGDDVFKGLKSSEYIDEAILQHGDFDDYSFEKKTDDQGKEFVEVALSENSSILKEQFGVTRLYDFDLIELHQQNYARLALNTQPDLGWFFDRGRTKFETSIFDDTLTLSDFNSKKPEAYGELTWLSIADNHGDDTINLDNGFVGFWAGHGDDTFDGGYGADHVWIEESANIFDLSFIKRELINGRTVETELSHADFLKDGIKQYHNSLDITGKYAASGVLIDDVISRSEFEGRYTAELFGNVNWGEPADDGGVTFHDDNLGGPGWVEYNNGYFIKLEDTSVNNVYGTDYYSDVEAILFNNWIYDPIQNNFYDNSGNSGNGPELANQSLSRDGNAYLTPELYFDPDPVVSDFGGTFELGHNNPIFSRSAFYQVMTSESNDITLSNDAARSITWNKFVDNNDSNIVFGTDGYVSARLLPDVADDGVNFTQFDTQKHTNATRYDLAGFSYVGARDASGVFKLSEAIAQASASIYGSPDLVLGSSEERGTNNAQADIYAREGQIYGVTLNGVDIDLADIAGFHISFSSKLDGLERKETTILGIEEIRDDKSTLSHRLYLDGQPFGSGQLVTNEEFEAVVADLSDLTKSGATLSYPGRFDLSGSSIITSSIVMSVAGDSNLGFGTGFGLSGLNKLLDEGYLTVTDIVSSDAIAAADGNLYKVNLSKFNSSSFAKFQETAIGKELVAFLNNEKIIIPVRDEFEDSYGDDVYRGAGQYFGGSGDNEAYAVPDNTWETADTVRVSGNSINFDISVGYLNAAGKIKGLKSSHDLYGKVVGLPDEAYVSLTDRLTDNSSGFGTNYLFDIEMIRFSDKTQWIGSGLRFEERSDSVDRVEAESYALVPELFDAQTNPVVGDGFDRENLSQSDFGAIRFAVQTPSMATKYFFGFDQKPDDINDDWDFDQLRISDNSWNFDVKPVWFVRNSDGQLVMHSQVAAKVFDGSETLSAGQKFIEGLLVQDNRPDGQSKYGDIYVSDLETLSFSDNGFSLVRNYQIETGTYDIWLGNDVRIDKFLWNEYKIDAQFGGLDYTFDGFGEAPQSSTDKIKSIRVSSDGVFDDSIIIDTSKYKADLDLNGGNDFVYLGSGLDGSGVADYSGVSQLQLDDYSVRFDISRVWVKLDDITKKPLLTNPSDTTSWALYDAESQGLTEAVLVEDTVENGYGRKLIVGVGEISFKNDRLNTRSDVRAEDWNGDGQINQYRYEGTDFDDVITVHPDNVDGSIEDDMRGGKGNDTLIGGKGGDRLLGGQGDDIIFGGDNGPSGNWHDQDRLSYWNKNLQDLEISKAYVAVNYDTHIVLRNSKNEVIKNVDADNLPAGYTAVLGTFVKDLVGSEGEDLLIDVEILETKNRGLELNAYSRSEDWNKDGVVDWANVEGTSFNDLVNASTFGADFMNLDNDFNVRGGDDVVFGYAGGDNARLGAGNDVFIGGENGTSDEWGWQRKDEARFDNSYIRYTIDSEVWTGSTGTKEIRDAEGNLAFAVTSSGDIYRFDDASGGADTSTHVANLSIGERLTVVTDKVPLIEGITSDGVNLLVGVEYLSFSDKWMTLDVEYHYDRDELGIIQGSWVNATEFGEMLVGTSGRDHFNDGGGDDIIIGGAGGDHFNVDGGDDIVFGDNQEGALDDGESDTARFAGDYEQFKLSVNYEADTGRRFLEVVDLLPGDFGLGSNKLYDIENISFSNKWMDVGVRVDSFVNWDGSKGTNIRGSEFDDIIDGTVYGDDINGGFGNDVLRGGDGADQFDGEGGDDTIYGGAEGLNPWGHKDVDVARYSGVKTDYTLQHFESSGLEAQSYQVDGYMTLARTIGSVTETDTLWGIERLQFNGSEMNFVSVNGFEDGKHVWKGTDGADVEPNFSDRDERFYGYEGNDKLEGGRGSDDFVGGLGDDILYGNNTAREVDIDDIGIKFVDTAYFASDFADAVISKVSSGKYTVKTSEGTDTLHDIEILSFEDRIERLAIDKLGRDLDRDGEVDFEIIYGTWSDDNLNTQLDGSNSAVVYAGAGADILEFKSNQSLKVIDNLGVNQFTAQKNQAGNESANDMLVIYGLSADWVYTNDVTYDSKDFEYSVKKDEQNVSYINGFEKIVFDDKTINLKKTVEIVDLNDDGENDLTVISGADVAEIGNELNYQNSVTAVDINGNDGDDEIWGSAYDDRLSGGAGSDEIHGGDGHDTLVLNALKSDATVIELSDHFTVSIGSEIDKVFDVEAIQFSDAKERLTVVSEEIKEYVYGQGFVTTEKIVGTNFDNSFTAGDQNKTISTGLGNDKITFDAKKSFELLLTDFDSTKDTFEFEADNNLTITSFEVLASGSSFLGFSSGATILSNISTGAIEASVSGASSSDFFIFDESQFSGSEKLEKSDALASTIFISSNNKDKTSWISENTTITADKALLNIGSGELEITDLTEAQLSTILELI